MPAAYAGSHCPARQGNAHRCAPDPHWVRLADQQPEVAHPYSVVLFDEVEKAHADVFNALLQVLDDGRLTDAQGRTVDFRNAVIIMTSNIGSEYLVGDATSDGEIKPDARERVLAEMRLHFRPEFLNRLDDIVLFKPLTQGEIERIVDLMLNDLRARLSERQMKLEITADAIFRRV